MGGKVFDCLGLRVPRMSPEVYQRMIAEVYPKLQQFFEKVVVPRDAPGKMDHGDIDFLVGGTRPQDGYLWKLVQGALGAHHHKSQGSHSFALPHPDIEGAHVQVDIELSLGDGLPGSWEWFEWTKLMKGDADLMQIIGIAHRPLGLTCTDQGLHVRLEQIEPYDKKEARLFLTRDPDKALRFYGLDVDKYFQGFSSETDLFNWVAGGRFFSLEVFAQRVEKADDRTRSAKRPMYRHFVEEYMPNVVKNNESKIWTRQEVLLESLKTFNVQAQYDEKMAKHDREEAEKKLWEEVKATIPATDKRLKAAVRALRRWVRFKNSKPAKLEHPLLPEQYLTWSKYVDQSNKSDVLEWVERNWQDLKSRDKAYQNTANASSSGGVAE
ncbi:uncharacterized protein M421DRAFT_420892 [Didymella exigua CBS 183.55]|uniref:Uncharacterized protein n=1 Tax=Didymella exigua CBS 183.55 TaxID=1150837 RepID=A0A6A5RMK3_9PLEO|nr:uncharacterized protein M421DRAFT_420892 [Didymella exigua CBS 183.55]KAF1928348.1 hypothetical protein M421DRAFT_420892 [Didymella exigua CBS 183.55]